jgi:hypothetical protein
MSDSNKQDAVFIPYYIAESMADRQSLTIKRLWITCVLLIILLVGTNALWLWYESQFEYIEDVQTVEQEIEAEMEDGDFTVIGIGDNYGKDKD